MTAFLYRMPAGIPGELNRIFACVVETEVITPFGVLGAPTAYGVPVVVDNTTAGNIGNMRTMVAGDTPALQGMVPYGVLARPYPTGIGTQDPVGTSTPVTQGACDVLKSGYINVLLSGTTPAIKGGQVYIWTAAASGAHIVGGWEAANPGGSGLTVPASYFMGPADANGNTEIAFNI